MDRHGSDRRELFSRRALLLAGGQGLLFAVLMGRLFQLQVLEGERYRTLAENNRIDLRLIPPLRGRILDRFGVRIAGNKHDYRVLMIAEKIQSLEATLAALGRIMPVGQSDQERIVRESRRQRAYLPVLVAENLSWDEFARLNLQISDLPGVQLDVGQARDYPFGPALSHVLGYVAPASVQDQEDSEDPLLRLPGFRLGRSGMESVADRRLRGTATSAQVEVNAHGRVIREIARHDGVAGQDVTLTIDSGLQAFAARRLEGASGAAVVLDVHGGDVLALVSSPGFDPSLFDIGATPEQWQLLMNHPHRPLTNKAVHGLYPPGSTFKPMVALAALESGAITPQHQVFCSGALAFGDRVFNCWKREGHGRIGLLAGIAQSCDIFFYDLARRAGPERIAETARRFGLGAPTGVELQNEKEGLIPTPAWKRAALKQPWVAGETLLMGIGQGQMLTTPLQLAVLTARLANGGFAVKPRLIRDLGAETAGPRPASLGLDPGRLALILEGMKRVTEPGGTGYGARIVEPEFAMAGKTGTSQVIAVPEGRHGQALDRPWEERDHGLFVGFAPVTAPRLAVAVVIEHGGQGSASAAPVARDILREAQIRDSARPPGSEKLATGANSAAATGGALRMAP